MVMQMTPSVAAMGMALLGLICSAGRSAGAADWPAYMHDNARGGMTTNALALPPAPLWTYRAPAAPKPAWPDPQTGYAELPKMKFDDALYVVAAEGRIFFGSSVDNQVHALDAATGRALWSFFTDGPVRLAPAYADKRIYAASDDGFVYCLQAATGRLLWKFSGAPQPEFMLGGGRVASLWPVRTGVLVDNGVAYFASGIFSWHGVRLYALTSDEGKVLWSQDGRTGYDGKPPFLYNWSPQGYLLATDQFLIVPGSRAMPAFWNRSDGARVRPPDAPKWTKGDAAGIYGVVVSNHVYVGSQGTLYGFELASDTRPQLSAPDERMATHDDIDLLAPDTKPQLLPQTTQLIAHNDIDYLLHADDMNPKSATAHSIRALRSGGDRSKPLWTYRRPGLDSMIVAGAHVIAGGTNEVIALDADTGKKIWAGAVTGRAAGLAVADGRLFVSTDQGTIHCFGKNSGRQIRDQGGTGVPPVVSEGPIRHGRDARATLIAWPAIPGLADAAGAARDILATLDERRGFAVVTGSGSDALACEIVRQSEMNVYVYEADETRGRAARKRVDAAGLYGWRVTVNSGGTNALPYPDYMANLIVRAGGADAITAAEWLRVLRPCGGVLLAGGWGTAAQPTEADIAAYAAAGALSRDVRLAGTSWTKLTRGPLEGSGWWTHRYADAGNSGSSGDRRVAGRLQVLWCGEPGANKSPDRHWGETPLVLDGRVFYRGLDFPSQKDLLLSFDAYNGVHYWERELPAAGSRKFPSRAGNLACATSGVFVAVESACHRLDFKTGETLAVYETPKPPDGKAPGWGYVAVAEGRLFGSARQDTNLSYRSVVFAYDIPTGRRLWVYSGREIPDGALAYGAGRLFFLDHRQDDETNLVAVTVSNATDRMGQDVPKEFATPVMRTLVALDAQTGREVYAKSLDVKGMGSSIQILFADGKLIVCGYFSPYDARSNPNMPFRRAMALSAKDGDLFWNKAVANIARPLVMGDWLLAPTEAYDLKTGAPVLRRNPKTQRDESVSMVSYHGCGQVSASASTVFFRDGYTTYRDLVHDVSGIFDGPKLGCNINIIPAGGVVAQVEASSGCACDYALHGTFVFKPVKPTPSAATAGK